MCIYIYIHVPKNGESNAREMENNNDIGLKVQEQPWVRSLTLFQGC